MRVHALPWTRPTLFEPAPAPRVAGGYLETVLVDVSDADGGGLRVRVYDDDHTPPESPVQAVYVFYRIGLPSLGRALESAWSERGAVPSLVFPGGSLRVYDFADRRRDILRGIESVHRSHLPG